ncbi:FeoB small GTPase domain-containing protein [Streptomyces sp. NPDC091371]|uniref:FeoB small GTPase domain-containing protein n=1 Tax=Streptomyces sp. NPDC091371 TaxID=3155303 RepID=UPI00341B28A7
MSCHTAGGMPRDAGVALDARAPLVALAGNPNVGKSTLFNALTGARQRVGNWPGKTVSVAQGDWRTLSGRLRLADLPGSYSLLPDSPDEALVRDVLTAPAGQRPDAVAFTLDAANPARNLYLLSQILDTGIPVVVALTMTDVAARRGRTPDPGALARELALPVVPVEGRTGTGLEQLADTVTDLLRRPVHPKPGPRHAWAVPGSPLAAELEELVRASARHPHPYPARWLAVSLLCGEHPPGVPAELAAHAGECARRLGKPRPSRPTPSRPTPSSSSRRPATTGRTPSSNAPRPAPSGSAPPSPTARTGCCCPAPSAACPSPSGRPSGRPSAPALIALSPVRDRRQ